MNYIAIIGSLLLIILVGICVIKYGLKSCLSDYYYSLGWPFMALLISGSILLLPVLIEKLPSNWQVLGFLCAGSLAFVGAAPKYKRGGIDKAVHMGAAIISALCSVTLCFVLNAYIPLILVVFAIIVMVIYKRTAWLLWVELGAFMAVIIEVLLGG